MSDLDRPNPERGDPSAILAEISRLEHQALAVRSRLHRIAYLVRLVAELRGRAVALQVEEAEAWLRRQLAGLGEANS